MKNNIEKISNAVVYAGSTFREGLKQKYREAIEKETNSNAKWVLETILENAEVAEKSGTPLCDDTGIPHLVLEMGKNRQVDGELIETIYEGIRQGLRLLPGRPMNIIGNDVERIEQSGVLDTDPAGVVPAPIMFIPSDNPDLLRLHILLLGGGPAIRGKTYRIYHKNSIDTVLNEIVSWGSEGVGLLGCSPCTLAIGIGRSHYEATALMMQAQIYGRYEIQSSLEQKITDLVNKSKVGPLGLGGNHSVLATFLRVGPQRASGVRIVSVSPCCSIEPRIASVDL